jgi:hypothetical protein
MTEAIFSSEMSGSLQTTQCYNAEDNALQIKILFASHDTPYSEIPSHNYHKPTK